MDGLVHILSKPIKAHGEEIREITFRDPLGADILAVGNPVIVDMASDPPRVTHDERKMAAMISRLGGIPTSSVAQMGPQDWVACAWLLTPFFVPMAGAI
ncbi:phage tail assembly protein [Methylobacterium soli]|uniref:Phage tail assembly protein n=1 Tax=Methylobacterium soli TaxID=553447 RepID=A0A6L3SZ59_9HYPH|nr:phage tail assembly protein [Methylobacterium soli]KAB1079419.1 phage tail assembly protein [Methylobacterium soli]GJE45366.1 hypothetical protein AEGHOMDF_4560 [Methylobacterium soli]